MHPQPPNLSARLSVVATPIGNLGDLSPRARQTLAQASVAWVEDTRVARALYAALELPAPALVRIDQHVTDAELARAVRGTLDQGGHAVLLTDAGTPAVSDPGARAVAAARAEGLAIEVLPGPSALAAAVSLCGWEIEGLSFYGFFPRRGRERQSALVALARAPGRWGHFWFESPHRLGEWADAIEQHSGPEVLAVAVFKELTKRFETHWVGERADVIASLREHLAGVGERGEWVVGILTAPAETGLRPSADAQALDSEWVRALRCLLKVPVTTAKATRLVSQEFGIDRKRVYREAMLVAREVGSAENSQNSDAGD